MAFEPITQLDIENYGCIQKLSLGLTPLHAFVGPNDSGKSTVLEALRTLGQLAGSRFSSDDDRWHPFEPRGGRGRAPSRLEMTFGDGLAYRVTWDVPGVVQEAVLLRGNLHERGDDRKWGDRGILRRGMSARADNLGLLASRTGAPRMLRLDPDELRRPSELRPTRQFEFDGDRGQGLARILHAILTRDIDAFTALRDQVRRLFPQIKALQVPYLGEEGVALSVKLSDEQVVPATQLSEGLLYYLGYAVLEHLDPRPLILIEEPENGLHPARIAEVMTVLREISKTSQVILATHSPLVLNELQPEEVTILTRDEGGTRATKMVDTFDFARRHDIYALGELWLSFADGEREAPLIDGVEPV